MLNSLINFKKMKSDDKYLVNLVDKLYNKGFWNTTLNNLSLYSKFYTSYRIGLYVFARNEFSHYKSKRN